MSEYADIKIKRLRNFIRYLSCKSGIKLDKGSKHVDVVRYSSWERPFPLPVKHGVVNKHIVKALMEKMEKLIKDEITTKEEIDKKL